MPLNTLQRETLLSTITMYIDTIESSKVDKLKQIEWLQLSISDIQPTIEQAIQVLKQYPALTKGLTNVNVPTTVRNGWRTLITLMDKDDPIPEALLKELSEFNNYNPLLMAEMRLFQNKINAAGLSIITDALVCLREAYLEMTPLVSSSCGGHALIVCFRLGQVPFNLDTLGSPPSKGDIQKEIKKLMEDRLKPANQDQKETDEKDTREGTAALAFKEAEKVLRTHVLLGEITEQQRRNLFKQQESPIKHDRLFQMQHVLLNNRITYMIRQATTSISKLDITLKESKTFLELRVSECCKVLLGIQGTMIEECFKDAAFDTEDFNKHYQEQLQTTYDMYLADMIDKWALDRKRWLSDGTDFSTVKEKFKGSFENAMKSELKKFQSFQVKSLNEVNQLRGALPKRMEQQTSKAEQYKHKWDEAVMPLMELADKCNELRRLRSQIQKSRCNVEAFNSIVTALSKVRHGLGVSETDQDGFNLLHYACWGGNLKLVQELLAQGVSAVLNDSEGNCIIHLAVENESQATPEVLEMLMKQPLFSNTNSVLELKNKRRKTPLHIAAAFGNVTAVQWIVGKSQKAKALGLLDLEVEADGRMTPLHYAAREGQEGVVNYLLVLGAGRSIRLLDNNHPLVLAIQYGRLDVTHLFFRQGIWLIPAQKDYLFKMAQRSDVSLRIAYCLKVPLIEGLNDEVRLKPVLTAANSHSITAVPSTLVPVAEDQNASSTPSQSIATPLNVSVLAVALEEPSAPPVPPTEEAGQNLLFDFSNSTRGRAVAEETLTPVIANDATPVVANNTDVTPLANATPSPDANPTPTVDARITTTATL